MSVRELPVSNVILTRIALPGKTGQHKLGLCPFHADRKTGSFVVTDSKRMWKCFTCDIGGDSIKFISVYDNIDYLEAAFKIALEFNIITSTEYETYYERRRYTRDFVSKVEKKYTEIDREKFKNDIASKEDLNKVFSMFIEQCKLSNEHKAHLKDVRKLSDEEIQDGHFFTFPTRAIIRKFCSCIHEEYGNEEILSKIPGFYKETGKDLCTFVLNRGIGIGIKNAMGQIVGIQIRHDNVKEGMQRYIWFSSSFAMIKEGFEGGTSSGSPVDVVYPKKITNSAVFITEGRFKAMKIAKETGSIAISVQGVTTWAGIMKELENISKSPLIKTRYNAKFEVECIFLAFDADMNHKYPVFTQARKLSDALEQKGYVVYYLDWNIDFGKGIDDVMIAGKRKEIKKYDKKLWDTTYDKMVVNILEKEDYEKIEKVPEEIIAQYFEKYFKNIECYPKNKHNKIHDERINNRIVANMVKVS